MREEYRALGVSEAVYERGEAVLQGLAEPFRRIDETAEINQLKVLNLSLIHI